MLFINTADAVVLLDLQRRIVDLNPTALADSPRYHSASTAVGQPFYRAFPDYGLLTEQLEAYSTDELTTTLRLSRLPSDSRSGQAKEVFKEIKVRWHSLSCGESLLSPGSKKVGWVIIIRDVTLQKQQQAQLERFAYVDSLTGLFNRRQLEIKAKEIFSSESASEATSVALLYVDLNHFKPINDSYGHDVGDAVLHYFAECLQRSVRQGDMVVRLGGDEFAALLKDADSKVAREVRSRLTNMLEQEALLMGHRLALSASIGTAYYPTDGTTLPMLLRQADKNMYAEKRAKAAGQA